jgi:hypothetical protein
MQPPVVDNTYARNTKRPFGLGVSVRSALANWASERRSIRPESASLAWARLRLVVSSALEPAPSDWREWKADNPLPTEGYDCPTAVAGIDVQAGTPSSVHRPVPEE